MTKDATPGDLVRTATGLGLLAWETQMIVTMRLWGMAGGWAVAPSENRRMVEEKAPAFADAALAASRAAISGRRPDQVLDVWTRSIRRRTAGNARRLARLGPKVR